MVAAPRILIAEDDVYFRSILQLMLRRFRPHFHLMEAVNGQDAYTLYQQHGADLILTDDHMPVMRGTELIHTLRAAQHTTPVVLLSSHPTVKATVASDPCTVFASKPVQMNDLLLTIDLLLNAV